MAAVHRNGGGRALDKKIYSCQDCKKKRHGSQWIYPYIKPELVINPSLDQTLAKVNERYCDWFGMNCESAKGPDVLRLLLEQLRCGENGCFGMVVLDIKLQLWW